MTPSQFLINGARLNYVVNFENVETATAPAQEVVITDQIDIATLDLNTFSLGPMAFGDITITPAPGVSQYTGGVDLRPVQNLLVLITAGLDKQTGTITWRFTSVDPETLQFPEDPLAGFLPPNVNPPQGNGSVAFTVELQSGLSTGSTICNQASIVFDVNAPILTPEWCNTIDDTPPQSSVLPLGPVQTDTTFLVQWQGTDIGAGIGDFTIYVSEDGGTFVPLLSDTPDTSTVFTGQVGRTYAFCSRSRDLVGTLEAKACPPNVDTTTKIVLAAAATETPTDVPTPQPTATPTASQRRRPRPRPRTSRHRRRSTRQPRRPPSLPPAP